VHCCWVTAQLYEQHLQACSEPVLQSSTEQWGMQIALTSVAVHWCWGTAHLHEHHICVGVILETQACFVPVLQSSTEQWGMQIALTSVTVH